MSADPGGDIRAVLTAAGIGLTEGTNLFDGPEQPESTGMPHAAAFVLPYGGAPTVAFLGGTTEERFPLVQILYRSDPDDYNGGEETARDIRDAIHHVSIARAVGGTYTDCTVQSSAPLYIGIDEHRRHRWTINAELWHRE